MGSKTRNRWLSFSGDTEHPSGICIVSVNLHCLEGGLDSSSAILLVSISFSRSKGHKLGSWPDGGVADWPFHLLTLACLLELSCCCCCAIFSYFPVGFASVLFIGFFYEKKKKKNSTSLGVIYFLQPSTSIKYSLVNTNCGKQKEIKTQENYSLQP